MDRTQQGRGFPVGETLVTLPVFTSEASLLFVHLRRMITSDQVYWIACGR
jgi:hypothetical protein